MTEAPVLGKEAVMATKPDKSGEENLLSLTLWTVGLVVVAIGAAYLFGLI